MKLRLAPLIIFSHLILLGCSNGQNNKRVTKSEQVSDNSKCYSILNKYGDFWQLDSVGKYGVRELITREYLAKCQFVGVEWKLVVDLFGKPNQIFNLGDIRYRYRLNYNNDDITMEGTMLLDILVDKKGIISAFGIYTIDG